MDIWFASKKEAPPYGGGERGRNEKERSKGFLKKLFKYRVFLLMLLPSFIYMLVFHYYPMTGVVMAFKKYSYAGGIWGSPWNGLENFRFFFLSGQAGTVIRNTVLYNIMFIFVGTAFQIAVAVFLTEIHNKKFRKVSQSMMFLPYFISWVIVGVMAFNIFSSDYGILNRLIVALGGEKFPFYTTPQVWPFIILFFNIWKESATDRSCTWRQSWEWIPPSMKRRPSTERTCSRESSR